MPTFDGGRFGWRTRNRLTLVILILQWGAISAPGQTPPTSQPGSQATTQFDGSKPFLSPVNIYEWTGNRSALAEPAIGKTLDPNGVYWDMPFAFNVPVEQPFDGGKVRIYYIFREKWETPGTSPEKGRNHFGWNTYGIYPLDGKPFEKDSVHYNWEKEHPPPPTTQPATQPIYLLGHDHHYGAELEKHKPFTNGKDETTFGEYIYMSPAKPGWYVLWWQTQLHNWPMIAAQHKTLDVTFYVDTLVCRGDGPTFPRLDYLLGRGPKPTSGEFDENSVRISTHELKVTFKKDGWTFSRVEVTPEPTAEKQLAAEKPVFDDYHEEEMTVTKNVAAGGPSVNLKVSAQMQKKPKGKPPGKPVTEEMSWRIDFPQIVMDADMADIVVTADRKLSPPDEPPDISVKPKWFGEWTPTARPNGLHEMHWLFRPPTTHAEFIKDVEHHFGNNEYIKKMWSDEGAVKPKPGEAMRTRFFHVGLTSSDLDTDERRRDFADGKIERTLFETSTGPWRVLAYYKRLKDVDGLKGGGSPQLGEVKLVDELDPYWPWYVDFHKKIKQWDATLKAVEREAAITSNTLEIIRRDAELLEASMKSPTKLPNGDDPLETPSDRALRNAVEWVWDCFPDMPPGADPVKVSAEATKKKIAKVLELKEEAKGYRKDLDALLKTQVKILNEVIKNLDEAGKLHTTKHPHLITWQNGFEQELERLPLRWALITSDRDGLLRELEKIAIAGVSAETRVFEAQIHANEGDAIGALVAYRSALRIDAKNQAAITGLKDMECAVLRAALAKSQGTVKIARDNFNRYMQQRGFRMDRVPATKPSPQSTTAQAVWEVKNLLDPKVLLMVPATPVTWPYLVYCSMTKEQQEAAYAIVTTGIVGAISAGIYNRPGEEANLLNAYEESMAKAFMGLHMLVWLREHGHPLEEIIRIDPSETKKVVIIGANSEKIKSWLPPTDMRGNAWTDEAVRQLGVCIHEAARLDEVMALLQKDDIALRIALSKQSYWSKRDISSTWWEWVGDFTSVKELLTMLLPYSIHTKAPRLAVGFWSARDAAYVARLQATGRAISGTEAAFRATGWATALEKMGKMKGGMKLAEMINKYRERVEKASLVGKVGYTLRSTMATLILQSGAAYAGEKWDMPMIPLITEALLLFGTDTEALSKFLTQKDVPAEKIVDVIRKQLLPQIEHEQKHVQALGAGVKEVGEAMGTLTANKTLTGAKRQQVTARIQTLVGDAPRTPPRPLGTAAHDIEHPLAAAEADIDAGVNTGSVNATEAIAEELAEEGEELAKLKAKADAAVDAGEKAKPLATPVKQPPPTPLPAQRMERRAPKEWYVDGEHEYGLPRAPAPESNSAKALAALEADDFATAESFLRKAREDVLAGNGTAIDDELPLEYLDMYLDDVVAKGPNVSIPKTGMRPTDVDIAQAITEAEMEAALAAERKALGTMGGVQGQKFTINDGEFFLKEITAEELEALGRWGAATVEDELRWFAENEMVRKAVYDALGIGHLCPAVNFKFHLGADGKLEKISLLYRGIRGPSLDELSAAQLRLLRKEISMCRVADVIIGDFDRKAANFKLGGDGRVFSIDGGCADVRGMRWPDRYAVPPDAERFIDGYLGIDHYWVRNADDMVQYPNDPKIPQIKAGFMCEQFLTYDAAKSTIANAKKALLTFEGKAKLHAELLGHYKKVYPQLDADALEQMAEDAMQAMSARAKKVDKAMQRLNMRQALPIVPLPPTSDAAWPRMRLFNDQPFVMPARRAA